MFECLSEVRHPSRAIGNFAFFAKPFCAALQGARVARSIELRMLWDEPLLAARHLREPSVISPEQPNLAGAGVIFRKVRDSPCRELE